MVNSVDQIVVDKIYGNYSVSAAIVNNNGKQELYVWGYNGQGQLGLGDTNNYLVPTLLDSSSLGNYLSIKELILSNGTTSVNVTAIVNTLEGEQIYVWGYNASGLLGIGNETNQSSPVLFNTKQFGDFTRIKTISFNSTYKHEYSGSSYAILETSQGIDKIYVWGANTYGQLGLGDFGSRNTPTQFDTTQFGTFNSIKKIVIDIVTSYAIIEDNMNNEKLYMWGGNTFGTCATGDTIHVTTPRLLSSSIFNGAKIKFLKLYYYSSFLVLTRNGIDELYTWGYNAFGQIGNGNINNQTSPFRVSQSALGNANEIIDINGYGSMMTQVKINGTPRIYVWGLNNHGQLGSGNINNITTPTLFDNSRLGNFTEFYDWSLDSSKYTGAYSNFAYVKTPTDDRLYVWGNNDNGQLGIGSNSANQTTPIQVSNLNLSTAKIKNFSQTMYRSFSLTLDRNGQFESYIAGYNAYGQLGIGNTTNVYSFTQILPTRYTKPQPKLVNPTTNISSSQALELINPNNTLNRTELDKYVDTTSFPAGSVLSIDPTKTNADYKNGVLNLGIATNQYNDLLIVDTVVKSKTFNVTINGFRPVTNISTNPVTTIIRDADGTNIDKIYDQVVDSTYKVINRNLLEYYFDLSSIPPNAVIHLYRTSLGNDLEATFTLTASQVYGNTGLVVDQLYVKSDLVLTLTNQINLALIISLSVVGGLLLIGSIVAIALVKRSSNKLII